MTASLHSTLFTTATRQRVCSLLVASVLLAACGGGPPPGPRTSVPRASAQDSTPAAETPVSVPVAARVPFPSDAAVTEATQAISGFGSIWVPQLGHPHGWVLRIGAKTGRLEVRVPVGAAPGSLAIADGSVWVANTLGGASPGAGANTLSRIDPISNRVTATVGVDVGGPIAAGFGAIFVPGLETDGAPLRKVDAKANKVVATFPLTGVPAIACGALWLTRMLLSDREPYPAVISRIEPETGARTASLVVTEGSEPPAEADGSCVALTGPNSASEEPTESWIGTLDRSGKAIRRSPRVAFRTAIMAGLIWIRRLGGIVQRIDVQGRIQGPPNRLPIEEASMDNWTIVTVADQLWVVGPHSAARIRLG
jgi:hypothetical protein